MSEANSTISPAGEAIRKALAFVRDRRLEAVTGDGCIRVRKPLDGGRNGGAAFITRLLAAGPALPAGVRVVLDEKGKPWLEAEAGSTDDDLATALEDCVRSLEKAGKTGPGGGSGAASAAAGVFPAEVADMLKMEGDWTVRERGDGLVVDLDTRDGLLQARLEAGEDAIVAEVEVLRGDGLWEPPVGEALGVLLLTVASQLRLVRACAGQAGEDSVAWFQVSLPRRQVSSASLGDALGALNLAWSDAAEEALILQSPAIASRYLAIRGWAGVPG